MLTTCDSLKIDFDSSGHHKGAWKWYALVSTTPSVFFFEDLETCSCIVFPSLICYCHNYPHLFFLPLSPLACIYCPPPYICYIGVIILFMCCHIYSVHYPRGSLLGNNDNINSQMLTIYKFKKTLL